MLLPEDHRDQRVDNEHRDHDSGTDEDRCVGPSVVAVDAMASDRETDQCDQGGNETEQPCDRRQPDRKLGCGRPGDAGGVEELHRVPCSHR